MTVSENFVTKEASQIVCVNSPLWIKMTKSNRSSEPHRTKCHKTWDDVKVLCRVSDKTHFAFKCSRRTRGTHRKIIIGRINGTRRDEFHRRNFICSGCIFKVINKKNFLFNCLFCSGIRFSRWTTWCHYLARLFASYFYLCPFAPLRGQIRWLVATALRW